MALSLASIPKRIHKTLANLRTGIVLLILVVIASATGHLHSAASCDRCRKDGTGLFATNAALA